MRMEFSGSEMLGVRNANCLIHQDGMHLKVCGASSDDVIPVWAKTVVDASWTSTGIDMLLAGILGQSAIFTPQAILYSVNQARIWASSRLRHLTKD